MSILSGKFFGQNIRPWAKDKGLNKKRDKGLNKKRKI
jgi:hypothetical protein